MSASVGPSRRHHERGFVGERPVVAVGHAVGIETDRLAAVGHEIHTVALDRRRGADAEFHSVEILAYLGAIDLKLRHDQPPDQAPRLLVEAHEYAPFGCLEAGVVDLLVVGADVDATAGDHGAGVVLTADPRDPADVLRRGGVDAKMIAAALARVKRRREPVFRGREVPEGAAAPLRPVTAAHRSDSEDHR